MTAVVAEDAQDLAAAAEGSADLGAADSIGADNDDAVALEEGEEGDGEEDGDEEDGDSDIELTAAGLQYATTRWDGSRNMTPNRRPTREEREGYIDNEELQEEVGQDEMNVLPSDGQTRQLSCATLPAWQRGTQAWECCIRAEGHLARPAARACTAVQ